MSQCIVPDWNLGHQRQEQLHAQQRVSSSSSSPHLDIHKIIPNSHLVLMSSNNEVAELRRENGQLAVHGHGGFPPTKPTWCRTNDTLESIVHQATTTCHNKPPPDNINSITFSDGTRTDISGQKTAKLTSNQTSSDSAQQRTDPSGCGSLKMKCAYGNSVSRGATLKQEDDYEGKEETVRSHSTRRSRAADVHNQSERKRRDRINQKLRALQKLVPNASKTDKASMLDEVIEYLKLLQAQIQMMSMRNVPQMMMPIGMQQHLQMSLLARMGMGIGLGMGMGMLDIPTPSPLMHHPMLVPTSAANPAFVLPPFSIPATMIQTHSSAQPHSDVPSNDNPYCALLAQSMNIDLYNKMAALYRQQVNQATQVTSNPCRKNHMQQD